MTRREIAVAGLRLAYAEAGDGPPVLLIPGLGLSARFYAASLPAFRDDGRRIIVPDPPGFGRSEVPPSPPGIAGMARLFAEFAHALGVTRAAWIGHSVSAQVCLALAAEHPALVERLVLIGPTGARRGMYLRQALGILQEAVRAPVRTIGAVAADYVRTSPRRYLALWLAAGRDDTLARARRVACPTLIVLGTGDPVVTADAAARLLEALPHGRLVHVPGTGHALPHENPGRMHRVVLPFLDLGVRPRSSL